MSEAPLPRRVLVTGATRGLGRALVERFDEAGHRVIGCGRSTDGIRALRGAHGAPHHFSVVDVSSSAAVAAWARRVLDEVGAPDLIVNNAAAINRTAPLWEVPADEFEQLMAVNVSGVANVVRAFVPALIERGTGVIVNLSSGWGRSTSPHVAPYCASKWAVEGLTGALADELPAGLAAVSLNPGIIDTDMLRTAWGDGAAAYPKPDEWSRAAAPFLLGLDASDNGRALTVG